MCNLILAPSKMLVYVLLSNGFWNHHASCRAAARAIIRKSAAILLMMPHTDFPFGPIKAISSICYAAPCVRFASFIL